MYTLSCSDIGFPTRFFLMKSFQFPPNRMSLVLLVLASAKLFVGFISSSFSTLTLSPTPAPAFCLIIPSILTTFLSSSCG